MSGYLWTKDSESLALHLRVLKSRQHGKVLQENLVLKREELVQDEITVRKQPKEVTATHSKPNHGQILPHQPESWKKQHKQQVLVN